MTRGMGANEAPPQWSGALLAIAIETSANHTTLAQPRDGQIDQHGRLEVQRAGEVDHLANSRLLQSTLEQRRISAITVGELCKDILSDTRLLARLADDKPVTLLPADQRAL
jgi:hypothetical protein